MKLLSVDQVWHLKIALTRVPMKEFDYVFL
jgi:hypothetical protein